MLSGTENFDGQSHPALALIAEADRLARQSDELLKLMASFDEGVAQTSEAASRLLKVEHSSTAYRFAQ